MPLRAVGKPLFRVAKIRNALGRRSQLWSRRLSRHIAYANAAKETLLAMNVQLLNRFPGLSLLRRIISSLSSRIHHVTSSVPSILPKRVLTSRMAVVRGPLRPPTRFLFGMLHLPHRSVTALDRAARWGRPARFVRNEHFRSSTENHDSNFSPKFFPSALFQGLFASRAAFNYPSAQLSNCIDDYDVGEYIGKGQNAAVYELSQRDSDGEKRSGFDMSSGESPKEELALKMMFNFNFDDPSDRLWVNNRSEMIPITSGEVNLSGKMSGCYPLSRPHVNIVKIHTAFVGEWKQLARWEEYDAVAPSVEDYFGCSTSGPTTLYLVMHRYKMSLKEYLEKIKMNYKKARVIYGQMLEAIAFLQEEKVSHRDLKMDNILTNFDTEEECPHTVLSDFGSAFSADSWNLHYTSPDISRGGNIAHLPPEVRGASPSQHSWINYSRTDIWAAGLIGYELFDLTHQSVMRRQRDGESCSEVSPMFIGSALGYVMEDMLRKDPSVRVDPRVAANVCNISLFCLENNGLATAAKECTLNGLIFGRNISSMFSSSSKLIKAIAKHLDDSFNAFIYLCGAEAILSQRQIDRVEAMLKATFLNRMEREHMWPALDYFGCSERI